MYSSALSIAYKTAQLAKPTELQSSTIPVASLRTVCVCVCSSDCCCPALVVGWLHMKMWLCVYTQTKQSALSPLTSCVCVRVLWFLALAVYGFVSQQSLNLTHCLLYS